MSKKDGDLNKKKEIKIENLRLILDELLKEQGKKQSDLITKTGLAQQSVSNIKRGVTKNIKLSTVLKIMEFFNVPFDRLVKYTTIQDK